MDCTRWLGSVRKHCYRDKIVIEVIVIRVGRLYFVISILVKKPFQKKENQKKLKALWQKWFHVSEKCYSTVAGMFTICEIGPIPGFCDIGCRVCWLVWLCWRMLLKERAKCNGSGWLWNSLSHYDESIIFQWRNVGCLFKCLKFSLYCVFLISLCLIFRQ